MTDDESKISDWRAYRWEAWQDAIREFPQLMSHESARPVFDFAFGVGFSRGAKAAIADVRKDLGIKQ